MQNSSHLQTILMLHILNDILKENDRYKKVYIQIQRKVVNSPRGHILHAVMSVIHKSVTFIPWIKRTLRDRRYYEIVLASNL